jgi:hypothetical protein
LAAAAIVAALLLAGCQYYRQYLGGPRNPQQPPLCDELAQQEQSPDNLPFETIARESTAVVIHGKSKEPALFVLTSGEDISADRAVYCARRSRGPESNGFR